MALSYNPEGVGGIPPGDYPFKVTECKEVTFKTGNQGIYVELEVIAGDRILNMRDRFPYRGRLAIFKHLCASVDVPFDPPPEETDLIGKSGRARFEKESDSIYLEPVEYYPKGKPNTEPKAKGAGRKIAHTPTEEDVPF